MWEIFCASIPACRVVQAPNESPSPTQDDGDDHGRWTRPQRRAPRRHFLSDYELATPTRPPTAAPTAPPAIRTVHPRSVKLGQSLVDVELSFVIFPSSSSEVRGVTFPIMSPRKTCTFTLQPIQLSSLPPPCLCNHQRRQEMMAWPGPHRTFR